MAIQSEREGYSTKQTHSGSLRPPSATSPPALALPAVFPRVPSDETPPNPAEADAQTPDRWVNRNPELIRLTGKHPFNAEAPLSALYNAGFLTPAHLHFVRNHGAVPRITLEQGGGWKIRVHGLVERECTLSLQDLQERFEVVTIPVTMVCAGNRRKEQNVVRKSLGFDWGAAGLSTALWTGVYLADILDYVRPIRGQAKHVVFEGADELPKGPYGTSQRLSWARSRDRSMLIAWRMNGRQLEPDHGFPVRLVVPGQIGGRSVKWLTRIEVSSLESQHHLHFFDNRVLPMQLSPEQAREEQKWWYDPSYLITELSVNSAITKPEHDEVIALEPVDEEHQPYTIRGYAYAGGGRRINRVEISLDDGKAWSLANIQYPEDLYRSMRYADGTLGTIDTTESDTSFCWCFWSYEVSISDLANAGSINLRAMDESMNTQPRDMYVNATSMLNNWWFRVMVVKEEGSIRFLHPAPVGTRSAGWMERLKSSGVDVLSPVFGEAGTKTPAPLPAQPEEVPTKVDNAHDRPVTMSELKAHDRKTPWFVVNGQVYDGTGYLDDHPGGADSILLAAGQDASDEFMAIHSTDARRKLQEYYVGTLVKGAGDEPDTQREDELVESPKFLHPRIWRPVKLVKVDPVNHDTYLYRFSLGDSGKPLGLPVGKHVFVRLKCKVTGEMIQRAYTPVSRPDTPDHIDLLVKLYLPSRDFPQGGRMTSAFHRLSIDDEVEIKGPLGSFTWNGHGNILWKDVSRTITEVGLVCGGSGITPILQVLRSVLDEPSDKTRLWLLYANKTEEDILCRDELDGLLNAHSDRLRVHYTLSSTPHNWSYSLGRITQEMLAMHLPRPSPEGIILVCGPNAMVSEVVRPGLEVCGWDTASSLVVF